MNLIWNSQLLRDQISLQLIDALSTDELELLYSELVGATESLRANIEKHKASGGQGDVTDYDQLHRKEKKLQVCNQFRLRAKILIEQRGSESKPQPTAKDTFESLVLAKFKELVTEEFGEDFCSELFEEARDFMIEYLQAQTQAS